MSNVLCPEGPNLAPFRNTTNRFWDIEKNWKSNTCTAASGHLGCTFMLFVMHSDNISWLTFTLRAQIFIRFILGATVSEILRKTEIPICAPAPILYAPSCYSYNTVTIYIMINFNPVGPNFHPFHSRNNRFWDIQKDGKSNMAAGGHLGCTFMLFVQHSDYVSWLTLTPAGPDFHPFRSRSNRFWDIQKDGKSNMAAGGHLGCTFMLFVQHSDYVSWLTLTLRAQIFIRFALGATVSEIFTIISLTRSSRDHHKKFELSEVRVYQKLIN